MRFLTFALVVFVAILARASEIKHLDDITQQASVEEKSDLKRLLEQIQLAPERDPDTGKHVFRVTAVEPGSVYDRSGIKVGDLVATGSAKKPFQKLSIKKVQQVEVRQEQSE